VWVGVSPAKEHGLPPVGLARRRFTAALWPVVPVGDHHDELVALDDDEPCVEPSISGSELDSGRRPCGFLKPLEQLGGLTSEAKPSPSQGVPQTFGEKVDNYSEGQIASITQLTSKPAAAAAMPFLRLSL